MIAEKRHVEVHTQGSGSRLVIEQEFNPNYWYILGREQSWANPRQFPSGIFALNGEDNDVGFGKEGILTLHVM